MLINSKVNIFFLLIYFIYIFCFFYFDLFLNLPNLAFSRESISLVIVFVTINLIITVSFFLEDRVSIKKIAIIWLMLLIPFLRFSLKELEIDSQSDPSRYYTYALQIIEFKTFLANPLNSERYLIDQPFYRYYLVPFILIFGKLNYFFTFFNLTIYVLITAHFSNFLKCERKYVNISKIIIIYLFISSAYIAKNILSVQLEWLCVLLSMMIFFSYIKKNTLLLFIFLAILSLQRQNFLLVSFFIFFVYIYENLKDKKEGLILSSIIFILILSYPLLHNIIFASSEYRYRYFSLSVAHLFFQNPGSEVETLSSRSYSGLAELFNAIKLHLIDSLDTIKIRCLEFIGYQIRPNYTIYQKIFGLLICPLGIFTILSIFFNLYIKHKIFLLIIIIINIMPLFILGDANWPRFQYLGYHSSIFFISVWMYKRL